MPTTHSSHRDPTGTFLFPGAGWRSGLRTGYVTAQTRAPFVLCFCGSYWRWVSLRPSSPFLPPDLCSFSSGWCPRFFPPTSPLLVVSFQTCWLVLVPFGKHLARGTVWVEALLPTSKRNQGAYFCRISFRRNFQSVFMSE